MTPIDRASRALMAAQGDLNNWDVLTPGLKDRVRLEVRAVLQAILSPSEVMIVAAYNSELLDAMASPASYWSAMVHAALDEGP